MDNYKKLQIEAGRKYGKLTVIKEAERLVLPSGQTNRAFVCKCDCGKEKIIRLSHLVRGRISSCGCIQGERFGESYTPLHNKWRGMRNRCSSDKYIDHHRYKDRGIKVCEEWRTYAKFREWALANGYREGLEIDRIDNNGNYEPSNCRFVTPSQNVNNREVTFRVNYRGKTVAFKEIMRNKKIPVNNESAIRERIKRGWNATKAIDTPIRKGNYGKRCRPSESEEVGTL